MTTPAEIFSRPQTRHAVLQSCSLAEKNTLPNDTMMKEVYKYTNTKVAIGPFTPTVLMTWLNAHNNPRHRRVTSIFNLNLGEWIDHADMRECMPNQPEPCRHTRL
jgi:hypothetical protein